MATLVSLIHFTSPDELTYDLLILIRVDCDTLLLRRALKQSEMK